MKQAGDAAKDAFNPARLAEFATAFGGVNAAMSAIQSISRTITAELREQLDLQDRAKAAQITLASARKGVLRNMAGATDTERQQTLASITGISTETGVEERFVANAFAQALSASGGNIQASMKAVKQASMFLADQPEEIAEYAGALLDLGKVTNRMTGGKFDAEVAKGLLIKVGAMSRVVDPRMQAQNIAPALIGMQGLNATASEAAALFASISNAAADVKGAMTGTGTISFAEQLRGFGAEERKIKGGGTAPAIAGWGEMTMGERIRYLQSNQDIASQFLDQLTLEKKVQVPFEQLLTDATSEAAKAFAANVQSFGGAEDFRKAARSVQESYGLDPLERVAQIDRASKQAVDQLKTQNVIGGQLSALREGATEVLRESGYGKLATDISELSLKAEGLSGKRPGASRAIEMLRGRAKTLRAPTERVQRFGGFTTHGTEVAREASQEELRLAATLDDYANKIDEALNATPKTKLISQWKKTGFTELASSLEAFEAGPQFVPGSEDEVMEFARNWRYKKQNRMYSVANPRRRESDTRELSTEAFQERDLSAKELRQMGEVERVLGNLGASAKELNRATENMQTPRSKTLGDPGKDI
jgi:hypothetical protein